MSFITCTPDHQILRTTRPLPGSRAISPAALQLAVMYGETAPHPTHTPAEGIADKLPADLCRKAAQLIAEVATGPVIMPQPPTPERAARIAQLRERLGVTP